MLKKIYYRTDIITQFANNIKKEKKYINQYLSDHINITATDYASLSDNIITNCFILKGQLDNFCNNVIAIGRQIQLEEYIQLYPWLIDKDDDPTIEKTEENFIEERKLKKIQNKLEHYFDEEIKELNNLKTIINSLISNSNDNPELKGNITKLITDTYIRLTFKWEEKGNKLRDKLLEKYDGHIVVEYLLGKYIDSFYNTYLSDFYPTFNDILSNNEL